MLREAAALETTDNAMSERVQIWPQTVEAQRAQKKVLDNIEEANQFEWENAPTHESETHKTERGKLQIQWNRVHA